VIQPHRVSRTSRHHRLVLGRLEGDGCGNQKMKSRRICLREELMSPDSIHLRSYAGECQHFLS
jgi:hypothetical protein